MNHLITKKMKTTVSDSQGVIVDGGDNGFYVGDSPFNEAVFGDRYDDLVGEIHDDANPSMIFEGYRDTNFFLRFYRNDSDTNTLMIFQMPHGWDITTPVHPHMHVVPMASGSGNVKLNFIYTWSNPNDGQIPAGSGWVTGSVLTTFTPSDQYVQKIINFNMITPPSGTAQSSMLLMKIERPALSDSADTYDTDKDHATLPANLGLLSFDLHYKKIRAGTLTELPEFG